MEIELPEAAAPVSTHTPTPPTSPPSIQARAAQMGEWRAELRETANTDGFVEENLWTGIGRARSGAGAAIVGDPDQVLAKIDAYRDAGIGAFILSGYTHAAEADLFARYVLPRIEHKRLYPNSTTTPG